MQMGEPKKCKMGEPKCSTDGNELPDDLKEEILAWMPLKSLCRFRTVSQQWNSLLTSTRFITTKWAEAPPNRKPWLVISDCQSAKPILTYCFYTQCWQKTSCTSISFMREKFDVSGRFYFFLLEGCAAGLFLHELSNTISVSEVYTVCNPLRKTFIELPRTLSIRRTLLTGIVGGEGDSRETYKVVLVGESPIPGERRKIVEIYDSTEKSWSIAGHMLQDVFIIDTSTTMVFCDGYFYCNADRSGAKGITGFSLREGTQIFALLPEMANGKFMFRDPKLLACGLRVLVAGSIGEEGEKLLYEVIIWEFEKLKLVDSSSSSVDSSSTSSLWKEIAKMPPSMLNHLNRNLPPEGIWHCPLKCVAVGDHVCFILHMIETKVMDVVVYNLHENSWTWIPGCPFDYYSSFGRRSVSVTVFEPRLNMEVG